MCVPDNSPVQPVQSSLISSNFGRSSEAQAGTSAVPPVSAQDAGAEVPDIKATETSELLLSRNFALIYTASGLCRAEVSNYDITLVTDEAGKEKTSVIVHSQIVDAAWMHKGAQTSYPLPSQLQMLLYDGK